MINQKLLHALEEKGWSIEVTAAKLGVGRVTVSRWVNGHQGPQPALLDALCHLFGKSADDLGFGYLSKEPAQASPLDQNKERCLPSTNQALSLITEEQVTALATLLKLGEAMMFDPAKRRTLETLLTILSMAMVQPQGLLQAESWQNLLTAKPDLAKPNAATIQGFESLIESCWQLSRGNELALVEKLLPECMARLVPLAQQPSQYQQAAANLAAQGFRLYGILALHKNDLLARELYCKQAIQYSRMSGNASLLIASLKGLGDTYYYKNQHIPALQAYQEALPYTQEISPLLQAKVYMSLAVANAHIDQKQSALRYLGLACDLFPDHPETDASFSFAEFDLSQMILWEGITRSTLGQTGQALDLFNRIEQPHITTPERLRIEIFNQRAKTAIVSGDLEQGSAYVEAGVSGAKALGSQRRLNEAYGNYQQMALLWPQEKRIKVLGELFHA